MIVAVGNDSQFKAFTQAIGLPTLAKDPRFATNPERVRHRDQLIPLLAEQLQQRPRDEWLGLFESVNVPAGPINTLDQVYDNPQVQARQMKITMDHPLAGPAHFVASPLRFSASPVRYDTPPPLLGEHTQQVLSTWLGLSEAQIQALQN